MQLQQGTGGGWREGKFVVAGESAVSLLPHHVAYNLLAYVAHDLLATMKKTRCITEENPHHVAYDLLATKRPIEPRI